MLLSYAAKLISRIPMSASDRSGQEDGDKPGLSLSLGGNSNDWKIDLSEKDMISTCFIINTAEYCQNAIGMAAACCVVEILLSAPQRVGNIRCNEARESKS